jgi:hypothetical protein
MPYASGLHAELPFFTPFTLTSFSPIAFIYIALLVSTQAF